MFVLVKDGTEFYDTENKFRIVTEFFENMFGTEVPSILSVDLADLYEPEDLSDLSHPFTC